MGGGTSIWASPEWKTDPKEIFNRRLFFLSVTVALAGFSYGFDTGNIGGVLTLPSFRRAFKLDELSQAAQDNREGTLAALVSAGGAGGALLAGPSSDFIGRKQSMMIFAGLFLLGGAFQEVPNLNIFYAGRLLAGVAIGATSMLAPQYLAENSPKSVRGSLTTSYNLTILIGLTLAFFINYGVSLWSTSSNLQWQLALGIQLIPGGFMFLLLPFVLNTPRALIAKGKRDRGLKDLCKLRGLDPEHPFLQQEFLEICAQVDAEQEVAKGSNYWLVIKDIVTIRSNSRRFFLAATLFLFHKFTGTDSLNYFLPDIFEQIGVTGGSLPLLTTGVYGIVKVVTTIVYVTVIVDRVGRRRPLLLGSAIQATCLLYLALYVRFKPDAMSTTQTGGTPAGGIVGIVVIYLYAFGWSFGWSVAPYVVAAEIFPSRIRSFCMAWCFFINWIVDFGITKATPALLTNLRWGTYLLYAVLTYGGCVFVFFCMPEFKGRSIESTDDLFQYSIWTMYKRAYPTEEEKVRHDVNEIMARKLGDDEKAPELVGNAHHAEVA